MNLIIVWYEWGVVPYGMMATTKERASKTVEEGLRGNKEGLMCSWAGLRGPWETFVAGAAQVAESASEVVAENGGR